MLFHCTTKIDDHIAPINNRPTMQKVKNEIDNALLKDMFQ